MSSDETETLLSDCVTGFVPHVLVWDKSICEMTKYKCKRQVGDHVKGHLLLGCWQLCKKELRWCPAGFVWFSVNRKSHRNEGSVFQDLSVNRSDESFSVTCCLSAAAVID